MAGNIPGLIFAAVFIQIIVWFVIAIALAVWVYRDAESRGMGGALWLIITLIAGIIGLIIYVVVRKPKIGTSPATTGLPTKICPNCGKEIPADSKVCSYCGKPV